MIIYIRINNIMSNLILILIGLFILLIFIGLIIIVYYIYRTYKIYKNNIDKNLSLSENNINNTSTAFDKLQDDINDKLNDINQKNNDLIINEPKKLNTLNSNLNKLFNINNYNDFINKDLSNTDDINMKINYKIINYSGITNLTDNTNYFKICDNAINENNRKCINLNIDNSGNFNIYPGLNNNSSNVSSLSIFNTNKNVLAKFDFNSNSISLGSDKNPAISIINNIYTPNIIVCNYTFNMATSSQEARINLNYISNFNLQSQTFLNFMINSPNNFYLSKNQNTNNYIDINNTTYSNNILKLFIKNNIPANNIINISFNIIAYSINNPIYNQLTPITTNGFLSLS